MSVDNDSFWLANEVKKSLQEGKGFAGGKLGTAELDCLDFYLQHISYTRYQIQSMTVNAGIWTTDSISYWCKTIQDNVLPAMDACVEWNALKTERQILDAFAPSSKRIVLRALEPYYQTDPERMWTRCIPPGTKVAIVSPFAKSIQRQLTSGNLAKLFPIPIWEEGVNFVPIRTGCSPALDREGPAAWPKSVLDIGWAYAVEWVVNEVVQSGAKVALVGCGALSLPIVTSLKSHGIVAIHTGGATQLFFGIKGGRWETHNIISTFFNEYWVRPLEEERPLNYHLVERGCYW
jgi:hypothetical protein